MTRWPLGDEEDREYVPGEDREDVSHGTSDQAKILPDGNMKGFVDDHEDPGVEQAEEYVAELLRKSGCKGVTLTNVDRKIRPREQGIFRDKGDIWFFTPLGDPWIAEVKWYECRDRQGNFQHWHDQYSYVYQEMLVEAENTWLAKGHMPDMYVYVNPRMTSIAILWDMDRKKWWRRHIPIRSRGTSHDVFYTHKGCLEWIKDPSEGIKSDWVTQHIDKKGEPING